MMYRTIPIGEILKMTPNFFIMKLQDVKMGISVQIAHRHADIQTLVGDAKKSVTVQKVNVTPRLDVNTFTVNLHK